MSLDVFSPPEPRELPPLRRAHLLSEIERPRPLWRARPRATLLVAVAVVLLGAAGTAVAVDLLGREDRPRQIGPGAAIAAGAHWALTAWRSDRGICLDLTPGAGGGGATACGLPVVGAPPDTMNPNAPGPEHVIAGMTVAGFSGEDGAAVAGVVASGVTRAEVELGDGRVLSARLYSAPTDLQTSLRFFLLELRDERPVVRAFLAYDAAGSLLERFEVPG